jgi:hypothetical protein
MFTISGVARVAVHDDKMERHERDFSASHTA